MKKTNYSAIFLFAVLLTTYIPIILTVIYSFNDSKISSVWSGLSLKWYTELFSDREIREALMNSLIVAFGTCFFSAVIGTTGAIGMKKNPSKTNLMVESIALLPIMIPEIILGMVLLAIFTFIKFPFGLVTLIIAHTTFCVPFIYMMVKSRLENQDKSIEEAARDLGATKFRLFWDITFPELLPGILSGMLLSFAMSFDDIVISLFVTGTTVNTLPIKIYTKIKTGVTPEINALISVMLLTILIFLFAFYIYKRVSQKTKA